MKIDELRGKTDDELGFDLEQSKRELFDLRFKSATETSQNPARIRELRRAIARMNTILHERRTPAKAGASKQAAPVAKASPKKGSR